MKPNKDDFFDSMDIDRDWIHTEVLGQGKKKGNLISNITVILVLVCTVLLIFIAFKDLYKKDDLSGLENTDKITKEQQEEEALAKEKEEQKAKEAEEAKKAEEEVVTYTVKSGDTLAGIGAEFGVDFKEIAKANNLEEPFDLDVGQELKIPGVKKTTTETEEPKETTTTEGETTYTVKSGDTLGSIAAIYGIAFEKIAELNSISSPYNLEIGQVLKIPKKQ